jgi:hypothetical protein
MEKITFKTVINAIPEKVWEVLWNDDTYRKWTAVFSEGSHAETDWKEGSKVLFLDGAGQGMVSKIAKNRPNEFMSIEHLGEVKDGIEDINSEKVKAWAGAHEDYTLKKINGTTELTVDMDVTGDFKDYFQQTWPKALESVKRLAE